MNTITKFPFKHLFAHHKCATELEYILEILPLCKTEGPWIAGGSLLRTYTGIPLDSDVDVFFQNKAQLEQYIADISLKSYKGAAENRKSKHYVVKDMIVSEWHTTITLNYMERDWKIQCVSFVYFNNVSELFESFDFDVCMLAYDGTELFASASTFDAIKSKKIALKKINYPSVTLKRLVKYMRQGYNVDDADVQMLAKSFKGAKEPRGILDEHFGIEGGKSKKKDDYNALQPKPLQLNTPSSATATLSQAAIDQIADMLMGYKGSDFKEYLNKSINNPQINTDAIDALTALKTVLK